MNDSKTSTIIKEYFNIVSPLLAFKLCAEVDEIERQILALLCHVKKCDELFDECRAVIEDAKCLQSYSDGVLLVSSDKTQNSLAYDIKMEALSKCCNNRPRLFDGNIFIEELKSDANVGNKNSCKLLAFLNWLGLTVPQNKNTALNIWTALAMNGDRAAVDMLIYGYASIGDDERSTRWQHIHNILTAEYESFSAIALYSDHKEYSEEEVQTANLIMFILQKNSIKDIKCIDRPMIHYLLNSKEDYKTKMARLSSETNYYLVMHIEDKYANKEYGF